MQPTHDFLGWVQNLPQLHNDALNILQNVVWSEEANASRIQHSADVYNLVQKVLLGLELKVKMCQGIPTPDAGSSVPIIFVESQENRLKTALVRLHSRCQASKGEIGQLTLFTYRRSRTLQYPEVCYTRPAGADPLWTDTRNSNFSRVNPFQQSYGPNEAILDVSSFTQAGTDDRVVTLATWINQKFSKV